MLLYRSTHLSCLFLLICVGIQHFMAMLTSFLKWDQKRTLMADMLAFSLVSPQSGNKNQVIKVIKLTPLRHPLKFCIAKLPGKSFTEWAPPTNIALLLSCVNWPMSDLEVSYIPSTDAVTLRINEWHWHCCYFRWTYGVERYGCLGMQTEKKANQAMREGSKYTDSCV